MKAIILSAGQGKRLLPLTAALPKCLLPIQNQTIVEWQVDALQQCGVDRVTVVTGYGAEKVSDLLYRRYGVGRVKTLYNGAFATTDNLVSCWAASQEMTEDFILLNGDTLFEAGVLRRLLISPPRQVTVVVSHKDRYDADDMKVKLEGRRLVRIGKNLAPDDIHGESIGMILFRDRGPGLFRKALEKALEDPASGKQWYLSVIDGMARDRQVWTCATQGLKWCEIDYPADLNAADHVFAACTGAGAPGPARQDGQSRVRVPALGNAGVVNGTMGKP